MPSKRILVVDDDPNMLLLIEFNLTQRGYEVEKATDGPTALRRVGEADYDLFILDLMLPGVSGFEITRSIRASDRTREIPVLLVTARSRMEDFEEASKARATDYITKPFDPIALVDQVDALLGTSAGPAR